MRTHLACVLCVVLFCSVIRAQNKSKYLTGRLVEIDDIADPSENGVKARFMLTIQDGSDQHIAYYMLRYWSHERKDLVADKDIGYRISGESLFVKTPNGKEIKTHLCRLGMKMSRLAVLIHGTTVVIPSKGKIALGGADGIQCGNTMVFFLPSSPKPGF